MKQSLPLIALALLATTCAAKTPTLNSASCASITVLSGAQLNCTATLNTAAPAGAELFLYGFSGPLSVVTPPASLVFKGTTASFTLLAGSVKKNTAASFTVNAYSKSVVIKITVEPSTVTPPSPVLTDSSSNVAFGNVTVGNTAEGTVTLYAANGTVDISAITFTGTGFHMSGVNAGTTIAAGSTAVLDLNFEPTIAGAETGSIQITSNGGNLAISLTGTGVVIPPPPTPYEVELSWDAPESSPVAVASYNVYRALAGAAFELLASAPTPAYTDSTVADSETYNYQITSVDAAGVESAPSNAYTAVIP